MSAQKAQGDMLELQPQPNKQEANTRKAESRIKLETREIYMLADILIGCWLNTGFRNSSCFGVLQPTDREKCFTHMLFQSCRLIFEHLFSLQKLPPSAKTDFDIPRINQYIEENQNLVYIFYTRIIDVELPSLDGSIPSQSRSNRRLGSP